MKCLEDSPLLSSPKGREKEKKIKEKNRGKYLEICLNKYILMKKC